MKKTCLLICILLSLSVYSQKKNPKTIFEVFGVADTDCPMTYQGEELLEEMASVEEVRSNDELKKNTSELFNAKERIAQHLANAHIPESGGLRVHNFSKGTYLERIGHDYTLYTKDNKVIWKKKFRYTEKDYQDNGGFNAYNKILLSIYYDHNGKLISDEQFEYIEHSHGDFFRVLKNKKWGLIHRNGKLVVPVKYDYVSHFSFNNKIYYIIREENQPDYYLGADMKTKIVIPHYQSAPDVIKNRYWLISGKVYDPVTNKRLFCKIPRYIERVYKSDLLTVRGPEKDKLFFDFEGTLLAGNTIGQLEYVDNDLYITSMQQYKDTVIDWQPVTIRKQGLAKFGNGKLQWITKPSYYFLKRITEYDLFLYSSMPSLLFVPKKYGLLDKNGKIILPEGVYNTISTTNRKEWLLVVTDSSSALFNFHTLKKKPLKQRYTAIYTSTKDSGFIAGATWGDGTFLLDSNYNALDFTSFRQIGYDYSSDLIAGVPFRAPNHKKMYYDKYQNKKEFIINDTAFDIFTNLTKLDNGLFYIELSDGRNFVQLSNNKFLQTPCKYVRYDTLAKWYTGRMARGLVGTFDSTGATIIPFVCTSINKFSSSTGFLQVSLDYNNDQLLDNKGHFVLDLKYDNVWPIDKNNFTVTQNGNKGIVNKNGKVIVPIRYTYVRVEQGRIYASDGDYNTRDTYDLQLLFQD